MAEDLNAMVTEEVLAALAHYNADMPDDLALPISVDASLGLKSGLDSLALITIFTLVEERIQSRFGVCVTLLEEERLLTVNGPLETISRFIAFLSETLQAKLDLQPQAV